MLIWGACFLIHVFFWPIICLIWEEGGAICIGITRFWEHQLEVVIEEVFLRQTKLPTPALNLKNNSYRYSNIHTHLSLEHAFNTEAKVNQHSALYHLSPPPHMDLKVQQLIGAQRLHQVLSCPKPKALDKNRDLISVGHHCIIPSTGWWSLQARHWNL